MNAIFAFSTKARLLAYIAFGAAVPNVAYSAVFDIASGDVPALIAAINAANDEASNPGADTINLAAGTYTLEAPAEFTDGPNGLPSITSSTLITGAGSTGANPTIIRRLSLRGFRIFHVAPTAILRVDRIRIQEGNSPRANFGGGAIFNRGLLALIDSVVSSNSATGGADPGGDGSGGGGIANSGVAVLINSTIQFNRSTSSGGGIENFDGGQLTIGNSAIDSNSATFDGGGIENGATATVINSTVKSNAAGRFGGGINNFLGPAGSATFTLINSTLRNNGATRDGGGFENSGNATLTNSTISGNRASRLGSGLGNFGTATLNNVTITRNTNSLGAGTAGVAGFFNRADSIVNISNTIISQNDNRDCSGSFNSGGFNLIGDNRGCTGFNAGGDLAGTPTNPLNAMLDDLLRANFGLTETHALLAGSPAIDAGNPAAPGSGGNACEAMDQRSFLRPQSTCDIGAFEFDSSPFSEIKIPIRWCGVEQSPSIQDPALVGESTANGVLLRRLDRVNRNISVPQAGIRFRAGAPATVQAFPIIADPVTTIGNPGDVCENTEEAGTCEVNEFLQLINNCRAAWQAIAPEVTGLTAVHINRFVDVAGNPTKTAGLGGVSILSNSGSQLNAGRAMVNDAAAVLLILDPFDTVLGHEFGHALTLNHGNGVDDDENGDLDDSDEPDTRLPLRGPNLMQYQLGSIVTSAQANRMRAQALMHIPDREVNPVMPPLANAAVDGLGDLPAGEDFIDINDFGVAQEETGTTTLFSSTAGLLPADISNLSYFFLADLDNNPNTGGSAADIGIPGSIQGVELAGEVRLDVIGGSPLATPTVFVFEGDQFVPVTDPSIEAHVLMDNVARYQLDEPFLPTEVSVAQQIQLELSSEFVAPAALNIVFEAIAQNLNTGTVDNAVAPLTFELPIFPSCDVSPKNAEPGDIVTVTASGFPPDAAVQVLLDSNVVTTAIIDGSGSGSFPLALPRRGIAASRPVTLSVEGTATHSDCGSVAVSERLVMCNGLIATIVGTSGNDSLIGTPGPDVMHSLDGNDVVRGAGGEDVICGGRGNDSLRGNSGNDILRGGRGNDRLGGNRGNDILRGGRGTDICRGGRGTDSVTNCEAQN